MEGVGIAMSSGYWEGKNVFITGCTGFIGYWLAEELLNRRATVTGLVRDVVPRSNFCRCGLGERINTVSGTLQDYFLLERALNEYEVDTVFHLGAQTQVGVGNRSPLATFETNIRGTWNLLEACRVNSDTVQRVIVASSDKAYGDQEVLPYTESAPLQGRHPYDVSKSCTDLIASTYFHTYGLPVCITRCGNIFGPGDLNVNRLIPGTILSVLRETPVVIRSDGTMRRDFLYVKDAVGAYLLLAEKCDELRLGGESFNFSNGCHISVIEMTNLILRTMGCPDHPVEIRNEARGEISDQYLSMEKAKRVLGWEPQYELDRAIAETAESYRALSD